MLKVGIPETPSKRLESCEVEVETEIEGDQDKMITLQIWSVTHEMIEVGSLGNISINLQKVIKDAGTGEDGLLS